MGKVLEELVIIIWNAPFSIPSVNNFIRLNGVVSVLLCDNSQIIAVLTRI